MGRRKEDVADDQPQKRGEGEKADSPYSSGRKRSAKVLWARSSSFFTLHCMTGTFREKFRNGRGGTSYSGKGRE